MTSEEKKYLSREDLVLLMDSYRNMIQMNSTILEQQKTILDLQHKLLDRHEEVSKRQTEVCDNLRDVADNLNNFVNQANKTNETLQGSLKDISSQITTLDKAVDDSLLETIKQSSELKNRIYVSLIGMGTIVLGLIGLFITILNAIPSK
jgi:Mg2+ and Co2+ transporter CorA